jgi:hypothetical protein
MKQVLSLSQNYFIVIFPCQSSYMRMQAFTKMIRAHTTLPSNNPSKLKEADPYSAILTAPSAELSRPTVLKSLKMAKT